VIPTTSVSSWKQSTRKQAQRKLDFQRVGSEAKPTSLFSPGLDKGRRQLPTNKESSAGRQSIGRNKTTYDHDSQFNLSRHLVQTFSKEKLVNEQVNIEIQTSEGPLKFKSNPRAVRPQKLKTEQKEHKTLEDDFRLHHPVKIIALSSPSSSDLTAPENNSQKMQNNPVE
jgi:hypothetical protein